MLQVWFPCFILPPIEWTVLYPSILNGYPSTTQEVIFAGYPLVSFYDWLGERLHYSALVKHMDVSNLDEPFHCNRAQIGKSVPTTK